MVSDFLADTALDDLEAIAEAQLTDTVVLLDEIRTKNPVGPGYTTSWVDGPDGEEPGLLVPASDGGLNIRADQPSAAGEWMLHLRKGRQLSTGRRARVTGETDEGETWTRTVQVRKQLFPRRELRRRALVVDV
jgi:hypothetical protein